MIKFSPAKRIDRWVGEITAAIRALAEAHRALAAVEEVQLASVERDAVPPHLRTAGRRDGCGGYVYPDGSRLHVGGSFEPAQGLTPGHHRPPDPAH